MFLLLLLLFFFLTLDHGKKLNDTLNIQTVTIKKKKKHILAVIFPVLFQFSVNINSHKKSNRKILFEIKCPSN